MMTTLLRTLALGAVLNVASFIAVASLIGGDAWSGSYVGGRYYLSNHGILTEVHELVYWYSYCHVLTLLPSLLVGAFAHWSLRREADESYSRLRFLIGGGAAAFAVGCGVSRSLGAPAWLALLIATPLAVLVGLVTVGVAQRDGYS